MEKRNVGKCHKQQHKYKLLVTKEENLISPQPWLGLTSLVQPVFFSSLYCTAKNSGVWQDKQNSVFMHTLNLIIKWKLSLCLRPHFLSVSLSFFLWLYQSLHLSLSLPTFLLLLSLSLSQVTSRKQFLLVSSWTYTPVSASVSPSHAPTANSWQPQAEQQIQVLLDCLSTYI